MATIFQALKGTMLLFLAAILASTVVAANQHVFKDINSVATLRTATWDDLDQIVTVMLDAFSPGDAFKYTNPGYEQYEDYMKYCAKQKLKKLFKDGVPDNVTIKVITVPSTEAGAHDVHGNEEVVAFAGWQLLIKDGDSKVSPMWDFVLPSALPDSVTYKNADKLEYDCSLRLGTNTTRADYHVQKLEEAHEKYIDSQFDKHLYLAGLATHPTWDGHNFGAMNLHWGIELAKTKNVPITLLGTPAGYPLYRSVGFQDLHNVTMKMLDGEGEIWYEAMKRDPA